ncbi:MAG: hypothetical protein JWM19_883 [Actinomycetia bacterium]|nr:hypothetical protein [Actinomycetes bacterium]
MASIIAWEAGLTCDDGECGAEFTLGDEIIYWYGKKLHPACARRDADSRRDAAGTGGALEAARAILGSGARAVLTRRQLRELLALAQDAGIEAVHRPDTGRQQWFGRMAGWSAARVQAGLSAPEVAGMWTDFLDVGRIPPLRRSDLATLADAIGAVLASPPASVTAPLSLPARDQRPSSRPGRIRKRRYGRMADDAAQ